jgi:hypothetical protein
LGAEVAVVVVVVVVVVAAVAAVAAVVEVVLEVAVAAEAEEVESAAVLDFDLQQQTVFATGSSSEPGAAAAVLEAGHSEEHSDAKPGTRRAALPCAGP